MALDCESSPISSVQFFARDEFLMRSADLVFDNKALFS